MSPLYLVHGEETFLVERAIAALRRRVAGAAWRVAWGDDEVGVEGALSALASRSLFGGATAVLVRRVEVARAAVEAAIEAAVAGRVEGVLVLAGGAVDRRKRWYAAAQRADAVELVCTPVTDPAEMRRWMALLAEERGLRLADDAIAALEARSGGELAWLESEIEKFAAAGLTSPVGCDAVARLVAGEPVHAVEDLSDRLARGDATGALRVLRGLLAADEPPLRIVGFLAANLRRALHVAEEQERGASVGAIATRLGMPDWLVRRQLGRGPAARLERALAVLAEVDLALKSSRPEAAVFDAALGLLASAR